MLLLLLLLLLTRQAFAVIVKSQEKFKFGGKSRMKPDQVANLEPPLKA